MKNIWTVIISCVAFLHCSGSGGPTRSVLEKPIDIQITSEIITTNGSNQMRFGYVLDEFSRTVAVFDTFDDKIIDARNGDDWDRSPIPAGEMPVAIAVDSGVSPHRIFVADKGQNVVWGFELAQTSFASEDDLVWNTLDLGTIDRQSVSRALFFNDGSASQLTMQNLFTNDVADGIESWIVKHDQNNLFDVTGSVSGLNAVQAGLASVFNGTEISFLLKEGSRDASDADRFYFSTLQSKPLQLSNAPIDILIQDRVLYILTNGGDELVLFNLDSLSVVDTKTLTLASPQSLHFFDGKIYMPDAQTNQLQVFDIAGDSLSILTTADQPSAKWKSLTGSSDKLYLLSTLSSELFKWDIAGSQTEGTLKLSDEATDLIAFEQDAKDFLLVSMTSGDVELVALEDFSRVDTETSLDADFNNPEFFDQGVVSSPELIAVGTFEGKTLTEQWQLVYEGGLTDVSVLDATIAGTLVTFTGIDLLMTSLAVGDQLDVDGEKIDIASIDTTLTLTLSQAPVAQGMQTVSAFVKESYVVIGSKSGLQAARVLKDQDYESDQGEIALFIRSSLDEPVTTGDFFTFATLDGVQPINTLTSSPRSLAGGLSVIQKASESAPTGYVLYQGSGAIGRISLEKQDVDKTFR